MITKLEQSRKHAVFCLCFISLLGWRTALGCESPMTTRVASPEEIRTFFESKKMRVLTFLGYSGAEYEDKTAMLEHAAQILNKFDPRTTIVNIGGTVEGIGAVYEAAKRKGFLTTGIVSTQAKENEVALSPCVDIVFFVKDASWGGFISGTEKLSPTSQAIVENSDVIIAIGGGEVARDELIAARQSGKHVQFIPAEMNHQIARDKALRKAKPAPTDFRGAAASALGDSESPYGATRGSILMVMNIQLCRAGPLHIGMPRRKQNKIARGKIAPGRECGVE